MEKNMAKEPINVLFVNCVENAFCILEDKFEDTGVRVKIRKVTSEEFEEMLRNDGLGGFEVIMFHLNFGEAFNESNLEDVTRWSLAIREDSPYVRLGVMSGAYDYEETFREDLWVFYPRAFIKKFEAVNSVVVSLKPDFYCSYTDDAFDEFVARQIAKGWLKEEEITWRNAVETNILTPRAEFGPGGRIERR